MTAHLRYLLLALLLTLALIAGPTTAQITPTMKPGKHGMDTSFARIDTDPRPLYDGADTPIEARILIKNTSGVKDSFILMFGLNGLSDAVDVKLEDVSLNGATLPIEKDDRGSQYQPKVWIKPQNITLGGEIVMRGTVTAHGNGQFHVGAIVIAFDEKYEKFVTPEQEVAEVYAFGLLSVTGVDTGPGEPPFQGQGNVPSVGLVACAAIVALAAALRRRV